MGEVELGGKHAGGSPRRRGTFRDSTLIGTATSTFAAGPPAGDTPARGSRRAAVHNGPRAALTTTIAAGIVAVATGSVAYSTALQPLSGTGATPDGTSQPQAAAPVPVPGPAAEPAAGHGVSDETRRPRPDTVSPTTQGGRPSRPLPVGPGARALPVAPPAVPGAPFDFTNPLLPGPPPVTAPGAPGAQPADRGGETRPARPGYDAAEAVVAAPPAARDDDGRYPARSLPVLVKSASAEGSAATADDHSEDVPAKRVTAPVEVAAPAARPDRDRVDDPHHRTPISVADWFARLSFRDPPPDPFTADPQPTRQAAPADRHDDDQAAPARPASPPASPQKVEEKVEAVPAARGAAAPAADEKAPAKDAVDRHADTPRPDTDDDDSDGDRSGSDESGHHETADHRSDSDKSDSDKSDGNNSADDKSDDKSDSKSDDSKSDDSKSDGDPAGAHWTSGNWFTESSESGGGFGSHR